MTSPAHTLPASASTVDSLPQTVYSLLSLTVYRGVLSRPVGSQLLRLLQAAVNRDTMTVCSAWGQLCERLWCHTDAQSLPAALAEEVLTDDNVFVRQAAAHGGTVSPPTAAMTKRDLRVLYQAATQTADAVLSVLPDEAVAALPRWEEMPASAPLDAPWDTCLPALAAFHQRYGMGEFVRHKAFVWLNGAMQPVGHADPIRLSELKGYEAQRRPLLDNTLAFLQGRGANNVLLYGDRGTGKSSTVKALLNEYANQGLRMIEMPKEALHHLPELTSRLAAIPMKFILFIDDLSFSGSDDNFAALKAVLEGGLAARPRNVLIYATSNRRHLLRETFSDRSGDEIHRADTVQESVSLSDRFGIFLTFLMPDKRRFLDIVRQMADDQGIALSRDALLAHAERWATERGGFSPRYARQFLISLASCSESEPTC